MERGSEEQAHGFGPCLEEWIFHQFGCRKSVVEGIFQRKSEEPVLGYVRNVPETFECMCPVSWLLDPKIWSSVVNGRQPQYSTWSVDPSKAVGLISEEASLYYGGSTTRDKVREGGG